MQPPDELMMSEFLPAMRLLVAKKLRSRGLSQGRIASLLGVTQASVSIYLSLPESKAFESLSEFSIEEGQANGMVALLTEETMRGPADAVRAIGETWGSVLRQGLACAPHRKPHPSLADCDVCMRGYGVASQERSAIIDEVSRAVAMIEASPAFVSVIPEVSVNLVSLSGESGRPEDIVGIPGRIVRVRNAAKAMGRPEFGASRHMSGVLLAARERRKDIHAAVNLKMDSKMRFVLKSLGLKVLHLESRPHQTSGDSTLDALAAKLRTKDMRFDAVVDPGGSGVEPNVYLFGGSALEVVRLAVRAAELYSAR